MSHPYISFIVFSRNDDYAGNMVVRLETSLRIFVHQLEARGLESEIVVVEWNPPPTKPSLKDVLRLPRSSPVASVRLIAVHPRVHARYKYSSVRPVHPSVALNVGIRRSRGEFLLPRMSDTFYSEQLMDVLAKRKLDSQRVYRCDRWDVDPLVFDKPVETHEAFLELCSQHVVDRHSMGQCPDWFGIPNLHTEACGDFLLMGRDLWGEIRGWHETRDVFALDNDGLVLHSAVASGAREEILLDPCRVYKVIHATIHQKRTEEIRRNHWGLAFFILRKLGLQRRDELRLRILINFPKRRISTMGGVVCDSYERNFLSKTQKWAEGVGPFYLNNERWGLNDLQLPEYVLCKAEWDSPRSLDETVNCLDKFRRENSNSPANQTHRNDRTGAGEKCL